MLLKHQGHPGQDIHGHRDASEAPKSAMGKLHQSSTATVRKPRKNVWKLAAKVVRRRKMENKELVEKANVRSYVRKIGGKAVKIAAYVRGGGASAAKRVGKAALAAGAGHRALAYGAGKMAGKVVRGGAKAYWAAGKPQRAAFRAAQKIQFGGIKKLARAGAKIASLHPGVRQAKTFARAMRKKKELSEKSNVRSYIRNVAGRAVKVSSYVRNVGAGGVRAVKPIASKIIGRNLKVAKVLARGAKKAVAAGVVMRFPAAYVGAKLISGSIRRRQAKSSGGARAGSGIRRAASKIGRIAKKLSTA